MKALFVELPAFERHRRDYLDEDAFRELQNALMVDPLAGDVIEGTGGLRTASQRRLLKEMVKAELRTRSAT